MKRLIATILCLLFVTQVQAEIPLTERDKVGLVGTYTFDGLWKNISCSRGTEYGAGKCYIEKVEQVFSLDSDKNLTMSGKGYYTWPKALGPGRYYWQRWRWSDFRRLSTREWQQEWKIRTLPGNLCDSVRYCFVATEAECQRGCYEYDCLFQVTRDYTTLQYYCVWNKGQAGWTGPTLKKSLTHRLKETTTASTPTPAQKPTLTIRSSPTDAKVYIGGAYKGTTELKVKLPLGNYSLRVEKSGYNNFSQQIELKESMVLWASLSKKEKPKPEPKPQAPKLIGTGTGFIVNKDYVVTAEHVLEDCNVVRVRFGHKEIAAKTVTMDASSDLGLLRLGKSIASAEVSWVVRIGLFKRSANADKYEARLRQHGLDPQRESIMVDGQLATRLFLGPFPTIDKADKEQQSAEIAAKDLALKITEKSATAKLRGGKPIRVGATVATYGYPLFGKLSDSAKITQGHINSLAGIDNDSSRFQYDAPTQFGNSGGPVLDSAGNVVGVVVSGLDDAKTQSINFAVKSNIVENFLSSNNVPYEKSDSREKLELPDIAEKAERFTVLVGCWE